MATSSHHITRLLPILHSHASCPIHISLSTTLACRRARPHDSMITACMLLLFGYGFVRCIFLAFSCTTKMVGSVNHQRPCLYSGVWIDNPLLLIRTPFSLACLLSWLQPGVSLLLLHDGHALLSLKSAVPRPRQILHVSLAATITVAANIFPQTYTHVKFTAFMYALLSQLGTGYLLLHLPKHASCSLSESMRLFCLSIAHTVRDLTVV